MFKAKGYRIIETKEEFLKDWDFTFKRYDNVYMPDDFSEDTAIFPMALKYCEYMNGYRCGGWCIIPIEEAKENILKIYENNILYLLEQKAKLTAFNKL